MEAWSLMLLPVAAVKPASLEEVGLAQYGGLHSARALFWLLAHLRQSVEAWGSQSTVAPIILAGAGAWARVG